MIYLIDDNQNQQRQNNYNITFVEEGIFEGYLISIDKIEKPKSNTDTSHLSFLKDADCILLHSTTEDYDNVKGCFLSGEVSNVTIIIEQISEEGDKIPLVLFSNSMDTPEFDFNKNPNFIQKIKKNLFYERLFDFMEFYKKTGHVQLKIFAYGKNFETEDVKKMALAILSQFNAMCSSDYLKLTDLSPILTIFKSFIKTSLPNADCDEILNDIEDYPMKIGDFKKKIQRINSSIEKYGRNIHNW